MLSTEQKKEILFLWLDDKQFHSVEAKKRNVETRNVYKKLPTFLRALRRFQIILKIPLLGFWLEDWKNELNTYNVVIIHASRITSPAVKYIHKKNKNIRIIVWYWNPVEKCEKLSNYPKEICERWSFDENDFKKFGIKYNTQYYFMNKSSRKLNFRSDSIKYDIFFVGGDKGRLDLLKYLRKEFINLGLKPKFIITKTLNNYDANYKYSQRISYDQNLNYIKQSKVILDVISEGQEGLTLRPLEALCFEKKLITNDRQIINRDFYHKDNIFILGVDSFERLNNFIKKPYYKISKKTVYKYDFDEWLERFFI